MPQPLPLVPNASMLLVRRAMVDGVFGDSRFWKAVAFAIIARRMLRKVMGSDPRTVAVLPIARGETLVLRGVTNRTRPGS